MIPDCFLFFLRFRGILRLFQRKNSLEIQILEENFFWSVLKYESFVYVLRWFFIEIDVLYLFRVTNFWEKKKLFLEFSLEFIYILHNVNIFVNLTFCSFIFHNLFIKLFPKTS